MSIIRAARKSQFYVMPTATIEDARLSWRALGVLAYAAAHPGVPITIELLIEMSGSNAKEFGKEDAAAVLNEITDAGYGPSVGLADVSL
jgi:hypothetical protein